MPATAPSQTVSMILRRHPTALFLGALAVATGLIACPQAIAFPQVGSTGEGAGQIEKPQGVAVDAESKVLYVSDSGNRRIDVFDAETGAFKFAFGWKVDKEEPKEELQICTSGTGCQRGSPGSGAGQFKEPHAIAVDNDAASLSHHDVYVYDEGNTRVEKFSPGGSFITQFGSKGDGQCDFTTKTENLHPLAVGPGGTIYVADFLPNGGFTGFEVWVEEFEAESPNTCLKTLELAKSSTGSPTSANGGGLAVDSSSVLYLSYPSEGSPNTRKFAPNGTLLGAEGNCTFATTLAIDPKDDLFIACNRTIEETTSLDKELRVLGYGAFNAELTGLAPFHGPAGEVYATETTSFNGLGRTLYLPFPPPGPIALPEAGKAKADPVGNTKATLNGQVNPEGKATKYRFEYVDEATCQADVEAEGPGHCFDHAKTTAEAPIPIDPEHEEEELFKVHEVSLQVGCSEPTPQKIEAGECLEPETKYRFRVFAENADGEGEGPVEGELFKTREPIEIIATWSSEVGTDTALLNAEVNPFGIPANGRFEYVSDAKFQKSSFEGAARTGVVDFGEAEEPTIRSAQVEGLDPGTTYHYRLAASDLFVEEALSVPHTFRTFSGAGSPQLPDGRTYEMVSPLAKNSGEVGVPTPSGGAAEFSVEPQQASSDGVGITYGSFAAFGSRPESAPATGQYLSALGPPFWSTENINPRFEEGFARDPFVGFSEDLSHAAVIAIEPALTEDATVGFPNLYARDNETGLLTAITTKAHEPELGKTVKHSDYCLAYGGGSADFGRIIFAAFGGALNKGDPKGEGFNLYEWSSTGGIKLASVLPNGKGAAPAEQTGYGSLSGNRFCDQQGELMRHAISADGSQVLWSYAGTFAGAESPLFARLNGAETLRLDEPNEGVGGTGGKGEFWDASTDGSKVFFTDIEKLTADAGAALGKPDLYRYDFEAPLHHRLTDLTPAGSEAANVAGVVGASEDGSYLYFGAGGNLYAWHEGETRLIATGAASSDWSANPATQSARVTPDGRHLAFLSTSAPTGYDNEVSAGGHCQLSTLGERALVGPPNCAEAYLYSFEGEQLICASCDPSGARPLGPTRLPAWSTPYQQPRYLSDDGSRLFFDTLDALSPHDSDERRDVYEFERLGSGSCGEASPSFSPSSGGCLYLISSGEKSGPTTDESYLLDASSSGDGVFFSTRQRMLPTDADERYDVYDARVGGVLPPPPPPICEGACHNGATQAAEVPPAATSPFEAPPQKRSLECPNGTREIHRKGKAHCVKPKKHRRSHRKGGRR